MANINNLCLPYKRITKKKNYRLINFINDLFLLLLFNTFFFLFYFFFFKIS